MNFGQRLKSELKRKGFTQTKFSEITGICEASISNYIANKYLPSAEDLLIISKHLNASLDYLLGNVRLEEKKIYIAGKVTGTTGYFDRFKQAKLKLEEMYPNAEIINPVEEIRCYKATWNEYMMLTRSLLKKCDTIYMMKGWQNSKGAMIELNYAYANGYEIMEE